MKIPVTGFLGSGKTTLICGLLRNSCCDAWRLRMGVS
jgi:Putative GTPases (G3E family)